MKLLTEEIKKKLPKLYEQDGTGGEAVVYLRLFTPDDVYLGRLKGIPVRQQVLKANTIELLSLIFSMGACFACRLPRSSSWVGRPQSEGH